MNEETHVYEGTLNISPKGAGYVKVTELEESIEIQNEHLATGLHGDRVTAKVTGKNEYGNPIGEITSIVSRAKVGFAGTYLESNPATDGEKKFFYVRPSDPKMLSDIIVPTGHSMDANVGQKVFVIIDNWTTQSEPPRGTITHVLGAPLENNAEMLGIALEKGFDRHFPTDVDAEANALENIPVTDEEIASRKDMRGVATFTIDPADAKDFDDALSFQTLPNGNIELGVHIADVSHYVKPGTKLDDEAKKRSTSVYLVDRTIPMLPEALSNDLCSLNANTDKLTMSAVFELDQNGNVKTEWFGKTIIHSDKRFTYEEAQEILDAGKGLYHDELKTMNDIAKKLTTARMAAGALSLDQDEVKFKLDDNGVPIAVYRKVRGDTNRLIEEYMLLANRKVAEFIAKKSEVKENIFVYRVHDAPEKGKMQDLHDFLKKIGHPMKMVDGYIPAKELNKLLEEMEGKDEKNTIHTAIIRSMAKAVYSTNNIGHYGLAFEFYTHFTSPIRRYPDTLVHRLLFKYLQGEVVPEKEWHEYREQCDYSSKREKEAADAERASIKYKQVEYMTYHVGEVFSGVVTGVGRNGAFVEDIEAKCEGMIRLKDLGNDFFKFDEKENTIVGEKTKKVYKLGDHVQIKVASADLVKKIIDYVVAA